MNPLIFKAQAKAAAAPAAPAASAARPAAFIFSLDTGSNESEAEDKRQLAEQAAARAVKAEPVVVKQEPGVKQEKKKRKASATGEEQPSAKRAVKESKRKAADADSGPTLQQRVVIQSNDVEKFLDAMMERVWQKVKQKKVKPRPGNKYGFERMDLFFQHYFDAWKSVHKYPDCLPMMAAAHKEHLKDLIKNEKQLDEVCKVVAEASVNEMTMFYVMLTAKGQEISQLILGHLESLPEEGEEEEPKGEMAIGRALREMDQQAASQQQEEPMDE